MENRIHELEQELKIKTEQNTELYEKLCYTIKMLEYQLCVLKGLKLNQEPVIWNILDQRASDIARNIRVHYLFDQFNIVYIGDLVKKSFAELYRCPNVGKGTLSIVESVLGNYGLHLKMTEKETCFWERPDERTKTS